MKRTGPRTEPCGTPQVRGAEGELCGGIPTIDVRDERYEVNHCSETEEINNTAVACIAERWLQNACVPCVLLQDILAAVM